MQVLYLHLSLLDIQVRLMTTRGFFDCCCLFVCFFTENYLRPTKLQNIELTLEQVIKKCFFNIHVPTSEDHSTDLYESCENSRVT